MVHVQVRRTYMVECVDAHTVTLMQPCSAKACDELTDEGIGLVGGNGAVGVRAVDIYLLRIS